MSDSIHEIEIEIRNPEGLHMRPAMQFVDLANTFEADVSVSNKNTTVDAKSIMQMTMLAATCGTVLKVRAQGGDARQAIESLRELSDQIFSDTSSEPSVGQKDIG